MMGHPDGMHGPMNSSMTPDSMQAEKGGQAHDPIVMWNHPLSAEGGILLTVACQRRLSHEEAMSLSVADHATINKVLPSGNSFVSHAVTGAATCQPSLPAAHTTQAVCTKAKELLDANPERDPDTPAGRQLQAWP